MTDGRSLRHLRAGPLSCLYENGIVRAVRCGEVELVRRVYMALRDQHWNTVPYCITTFSLNNTTDSFRLSFEAIHRARDIGFVWQCTITGTNKGTIELVMRGTATTTFLRNRIGWCVLHPSTCNNVPCNIGHPDGSCESGTFPGDHLAPHQPFVNIRTMRYPVASGDYCTLDFSGDVFETEDQRNWTDATFKTYSTPQSLPAPVEVVQGTVIEQTVRIAVETKVANPPQIHKASPVIDLTALKKELGPAPAIGLRYLPDSPTVHHVAQRLTTTGVTHLRTELFPSTAATRQHLTDVCEMAIKLGAAVEIALHCSDAFKKELPWLSGILSGIAPVSLRFLVYDTGSVVTRPEIVNVAVEHLRQFGSIYSGTNRYFVEINRSHAPVEAIDGVCFSANPQVHTFDDRAVMENVEGLAACCQAGRLFYPNKKIALSPLTMRPRKDPVRPLKDGGADPRQQKLFGAAWLTASIAACISAGIDVLTALGTAGAEGIMSDDGSKLFPVYHIIASGICGAEATTAVRYAVDEELITALVARREEDFVILIANGTPECSDVNITGIPQTAWLAQLDTTTTSRAELDPDFWEHEQRPLQAYTATIVRLAPYGVARLVIPR